ncbi:hypothetical protein [Carboxylicivirga litoralis]|nr:hypothetical protein [Carboxylicivirga sp. A043]
MNTIKKITNKQQDGLHFSNTWIGVVAITIIVLLIRLIIGSI